MKSRPVFLISKLSCSVFALLSAHAWALPLNRHLIDPTIADWTPSVVNSILSKTLSPQNGENACSVLAAQNFQPKVVLDPCADFKTFVCGSEEEIDQTFTSALERGDKIAEAAEKEEFDKLGIPGQATEKKTLSDLVWQAKTKSFYRDNYFPAFLENLENRVLKETGIKPEEEFNSAKKDLETWINSNPDLNQETKQAMIEGLLPSRYSSMKKEYLRGKKGIYDCGDGLGFNAEFDVQGAKAISICPIFFLLSGERIPLHVLVHEYGHAMSVFRMTPEYDRLLRCSDQHLKTDSDHFEETFADFIASEMVGEKLKKIEAPEEKKSVLRKEVFHLCKSLSRVEFEWAAKKYPNETSEAKARRFERSEKRDEKDSYHNLEKRLLTMGRNRKVREALGCTPPTQEWPSCDFGGVYPREI